MFWSPKPTSSFPPFLWGALAGVMGRVGAGRAARCWARPGEGMRTLLGTDECKCHRGKAGRGRAAGSAPCTQPSRRSAIPSRGSTASRALAPRRPASPPRLRPAPRRSDGSGAVESVCAFCLLFLLGWKSRGRGVPGLGRAAPAAGASGASCPTAGSLWTQVRLGTAGGGGGAGVALRDQGWPNPFGSPRTERFLGMRTSQFI